MAKKDSTIENVDAPKISRKDLGEQRSKLYEVQGNDGTFTRCQRNNKTGDIAVNFELDGYLIRASINPITQKVRGRVIPIPAA